MFILYKAKSLKHKKGQTQNIFNTKKYKNQNKITKKHRRNYYLAAKRELKELTLTVTEQRIE